MLRQKYSTGDYQSYKDNSCKIYLEALFKDKILHQEYKEKEDSVTILVKVKKTDIENIKRLLPADAEITQQQAETPRLA